MTHLTQTNFLSHKNQVGISTTHLTQINFRLSKNPKLVPLTQIGSPAIFLTASNFLFKHKPCFVLFAEVDCWLGTTKIYLPCGDFTSKNLSIFWETLPHFPDTMFGCQNVTPNCLHYVISENQDIVALSPFQFCTFWRTAACLGLVLLRSWSHILDAQEKSCENAVVGQLAPDIRDGLGMLSENNNLPVSLLTLLERILQGLIRIFGMKFHRVGVSHPVR